MRYIINKPRVPQTEPNAAEVVAAELVTMKLAINPAMVTDRLHAMGEADALRFGEVSVIAIADEVMPATMVDVTPVDVAPEPVAHIVETRTETTIPLERAEPRPMTTSNIGRPRVK